jgi:hypothetical protein
MRNTDWSFIAGMSEVLKRLLSLTKVRAADTPRSTGSALASRASADHFTRLVCRFDGVTGLLRLGLAHAHGGNRILAAFGRGWNDRQVLHFCTQTTFHGSFYRAVDTDSLKNIYEQINRLEKTTQVAQHFEHYQELHTWALFPAIALLGLGFGLENTGFRRLP